VSIVDTTNGRSGDGVVVIGGEDEGSAGEHGTTLHR